MPSAVPLGGRHGRWLGEGRLCEVRPTLPRPPARRAAALTLGGSRRAGRDLLRRALPAPGTATGDRFARAVGEVALARHLHLARLPAAYFGTASAGPLGGAGPAVRRQLCPTTRLCPRLSQGAGAGSYRLPGGSRGDGGDGFGAAPVPAPVAPRLVTLANR